MLSLGNLNPNPTKARVTNDIHNSNYVNYSKCHLVWLDMGAIFYNWRFKKARQKMKLIIDIPKDTYKRLTLSPSHSDEDVAQSVVDRMLLVKAVREAIPYKESETENER